MKVAARILEQYPELTKSQRAVVGHVDGPLLVIAGPGSGKTHSIVLRALNLLLLRKAAPKEIVLCTFTEKAAFEMRDRLAAAARKAGCNDDLSELTISTIHGFCNRLLTEHRHRTSLGHGYETLDDLTQLLFIFEHFDVVVGEARNGKYLQRWTTRWTAIEGARSYFNKITEELVDPALLAASDDAFLAAIGAACQRYEEALREKNRVDFAHLQRLAYDLLQDADSSSDAVVPSVRFLLVDEYQDTNHIQEQLLVKLAGTAANLCVVGDEDQSLYRFRGATVRNILEFPQRFPNCAVVQLTTNYRSHRDIVERYDRWMASADWSNKDGGSFRYDKAIIADPQADHLDYPSVVRIWGTSQRDEAERFADLVAFLRDECIVTDYNQIALLLHSVREEHSGRYLAALAAKGIPVFCPRARGFFDVAEIRHLVACFAVLFGWIGDGRGKTAGRVLKLANYVDAAIVEVGRRFASPHPLAKALQRWTTDIAALREGQTLDYRPADYFYELLALEPFRTAARNENTARNLAIFSNLVGVFQTYYHYTVVTHRNREFIRFHFFASFLRLLYDGGINEYEDQDAPFPKGHVQVMTIHQAKGLEFPVVAVGALSKQLSSPKQIDRQLGAFYHRPAFEPPSRTTLFDRMRLHYVAFSRPQNLLVLTAHEQPKPHFAPIWEDLPQWPYVEKERLAAQTFDARERVPAKKSYSFTGDLAIYETCPRQYQFFREYDFTPSRSAVIFFGLLVHQTIEDIHRIAIDGKLHTLNRARIRDLFERIFGFLCLSEARPIDEAAKEAAFRQVLSYFKQNQPEMRRVIEAEVDVSLEKENYILVGKVDLLLGGDGKLELLDFKTSPRPTDSPALLDAYERQLCTYAHILEQRRGRRVDRLLLYWTAEERKEDALMVLPYRPERVDAAGKHFDATVRRIQARKFAVAVPPEPRICRECDLRMLCRAEGMIGGEVD